MNQIINLQIFDRIIIYYGKIHHSDLKRPVPRADIYRNKTKKMVNITVVEATNQEAMLTGRNRMVLMTDDGYHISKKNQEAFVNGFDNNTIVSFFNVLPVVAHMENKTVRNPYGARVEIYEPEKTWSQTFFRPLTTNEALKRDTYTHILEDGTYYTGSRKLLDDMLSIPTTAGVTKTFDTINDYHQVMIIGNTIAPTPPFYRFIMPRHVLYGNGAEYMLIPEKCHNKVRNFVWSSDYTKLSSEKVEAYIRAEPVLCNLPQEFISAAIFLHLQLISEHYCIYKNQTLYSEFGSGIFTLWKTLTISKFRNRTQFLLAKATNSLTLTFGRPDYLIDWYGSNSKVEPGATTIVQSLDVDPDEDQGDNNPIPPEGNLTDPRNGPQAPETPQWEEFEPKKFTWMEYHNIWEAQAEYIFEVHEKEVYETTKKWMAELTPTTIANIDRWLNGVAGGGKSVEYLQMLADVANLHEWVVICPTGELVQELSEKFDALRPGWRDENKYLFQTYARGFARCGGKHVIIEEAWLCPSAVTVGCAFLRGHEALLSLTIVGDYHQHMFNPEIIPGQDWVKVIKLVANASRWRKKLTKMYRCSELVAGIVRIINPEIEITGNPDRKTFVTIEQEPNHDIEYFISQSRNNGEKFARRGFSVVTAVESQGATVDKAIFLPSRNFYPDGWYVGITRAKERLVIIKPTEMDDVNRLMFEDIEAYIAEHQTETDLPPIALEEPVATVEGEEVLFIEEEVEYTTYGNAEEEPTPVHYQPVEISEENLNKMEIISKVADVPFHQTRKEEDTAFQDFLDEEIPSVVTGDILIPHNLRDITTDDLFDQNDDIGDVEKTTCASIHKQSNKKLVENSLAASLARNPELIDDDVNLEELFPELRGFHFDFNEDKYGSYVDRYITKLSLQGLEHQVLDDIHELLMSFKNQLKGGITEKNKLSPVKVGQIVRATSKYFQITVGFMLNYFYEELHMYLKQHGVFTGCQENDAAVQEFLKDVDYPNALTYDVVKNESRIGAKTKKFEREFVAYYTGIPEMKHAMEELDADKYVQFGDVRIDCSGIRNSGEPGTLSRNFTANYALAKRTLGPAAVAKLLIKGDNVAIFSNLPRAELEHRFKYLVAEGKIEVDAEPEWTSYYLEKSELGHWVLIPNYSYIGERMFSNLIREDKMITESELLNYRVLFARYNIDKYKREISHPRLFNEFAEAAYAALEDADLFYDYLIKYKLQLFNTKTQNIIINHGLNKQAESSSSPSTSQSETSDGAKLQQPEQDSKSWFGSLSW